MVVGLICIIGFYGLAVLLMHGCYARFRGKGRKPVHYVLVTNNNETQLEWYVRSLLFFSWLKGKPIFLVIADEGSTDGTLAIARILKRHEPAIDIVEWADSVRLDRLLAGLKDEAVVTVRLGNDRKLQQIPLLP